MRQIRLRIYELLRPLIQKLPDTSKLTKKRGQLTLQQQLEYEYDYFFRDSKGEYNLDNCLYDIEIHNNLPHDQSMLFGKTIYCDICSQNHKDNCMFAF